MVYRAIGLMSGSSLDGLDIVFAEFNEAGGKWGYEIKAADCFAYDNEWVEKLRAATKLDALEYQLLHTSYGHYLGQQVKKFIAQYKIDYQAALISSHGHTTFHYPAQRMTAQLGDGAAIAAETELPVVSDLRALDVAFGGQGAPIVPIGEKLLLGAYDFYLNLGGIANVSVNADEYIAFDICAANRVLNMLAAEAGKEFDEGGAMASSGRINKQLLDRLNKEEYYKKPFPKSLANEFGTDVIYPMIRSFECSIADALATYTEHIAVQIGNSVSSFTDKKEERKMLVTGGGAFNHYLTSRIQNYIGEQNIKIVIPDSNLIQYKEALIMALIGVLRWRQEHNVISTVTGASRSSIGGALWMGHE